MRDPGRLPTPPGLRPAPRAPLAFPFPPFSGPGPHPGSRPVLAAGPGGDFGLAGAGLRVDLRQAEKGASSLESWAVCATVHYRHWVRFRASGLCVSWLTPEVIYYVDWKATNQILMGCLNACLVAGTVQ